MSRPGRGEHHNAIDDALFGVVAQHRQEVFQRVLAVISEIYVRSLAGTKYVMLLANWWAEEFEEGRIQLDGLVSRTKEASDLVAQRRRSDIEGAVASVTNELATAIEVARGSSREEEHLWAHTKSFFEWIGPPLLENLAGKLAEMEREVVVEFVAIELRHKGGCEVYDKLRDLYPYWTVPDDLRHQGESKGEENPQQAFDKWVRREQEHGYLKAIQTARETDETGADGWKPRRQAVGTGGPAMEQGRSAAMGKKLNGAREKEAVTDSEYRERLRAIERAYENPENWIPLEIVLDEPLRRANSRRFSFVSSKRRR